MLNTLKSAGLTVTWVQVGNEINSGMLWPVGNTSNGFGPLAGLINSGYNAVKSVYPGAQVVIHLATRTTPQPDTFVQWPPWSTHG